MSNVPKNNPPRQRLDVALVKQKLVSTRAQAENYIKLGRVRVNRKTIDKTAFRVKSSDKILVEGDQYVSRAALKLASVAEKLKLDFKDQLVLDVGSSTGGFTDYTLQHGASQVIAVDVGTDQLHPKLRADKRVELHEKTDIRNWKSDVRSLTTKKIDIVLVDVSFISLKKILPAIYNLPSANLMVLAMVKPQFEAGSKLLNKGVIKNDTIRRKVLSDFESWAKEKFVIIDKADAEITGSKGNRERFYLLKKL